MSSGENNITRPAGFWIRLAAQLLDGIIIGIPTSIIYNLILLPFVLTSAHEDYVNPVQLVTTSFTATLVILIIELAYFILIPTFWNGFTPGKRIVGIQIARIDGGNVGFGTMLLRYLVGGIADSIALSGLVSLILLLARSDKRTLHDLIASTYVKHIK